MASDKQNAYKVGVYESLMLMDSIALEYAKEAIASSANPKDWTIRHALREISEVAARLKGAQEDVESSQSYKDHG